MLQPKQDSVVDRQLVVLFCRGERVNALGTIDGGTIGVESHGHHIENGFVRAVGASDPFVGPPSCAKPIPQIDSCLDITEWRVPRSISQWGARP